VLDELAASIVSIERIESLACVRAVRST